MKNIRTDVVKKSLDDIAKIGNFIKENTSTAVQNLLREAVAQEYVKIVSESYDDDSEDVENTSEENIEINDTETEDTSSEDNGDESIDTEEEEDVTITDDSVDEEGEESDFENEESDPEETADLTDFETETGQYDLRNADDETLVKVYKLLKHSDEVEVVKTDSKLELKDNQTGAEYLIDLDSTCEGDECDTPEDDDESFDEDNFENTMRESRERIVEIVLNENANLGYTTNYQKNDPLTTPSMKEPGKNVNDWDAGVPKGKSKPWPGKGTTKKGKFFNEEDISMDGSDMDSIEESENVAEKDVNSWGLDHTPKKGNKVPVKTASTWGTDKNSSKKASVNECGEACVEEEEDLEEANLSQSRWNDTHAAHNRVPAANKDSYRRDGMQKTSKGTTYREHGGSMDESVMMKKHKKIVAENKKMKATLDKLQKLVMEAAVTNLNLGQIVKLLNENSTTQDEKREIIARFGKEAKTIKESKELYSKISDELKKRNIMNINEEKQFITENSNKINENTIYASKDLMASLDLMRRICK